MKLAFVFPGQGSQSVGMLASFVGVPAVDDVIERASRALGWDIGALIANGPAEDLNLTVNTQPAMLVAGYAVQRAWEAAGGPRPQCVAGHSLGEYAALTVAGALTFEDAVKLVRFRAQAMQDAVPVGTGSMAAILGLPDAEVKEACSEAAQGEIVEAVNFNAPSQVVIAGSKAAVERACEAAKRRGAKRALVLAVSAPFHSSLMRPAGERLRTQLASITIRPAAIPLINNIDVAIETEPAKIADALVRQASGPVRWSDTVLKMSADGITHILEMGPGKVLAGLTRRIAPNIESIAVADAAALQDALARVKTQ